MKYHLHSFKSLIKTSLYKIIIIYFILSSILVLSTIISNEFITDQNFLMLLGIDPHFQKNFLSFLWTLFQYLITAHITLEYIYFETNHSPEFLSLRFSNIKNISIKFLVLVIFCIFFRTLTFLIYYLLYTIYTKSIKVI